MNAAVFLDRDNTLIDNDGDLGDPSKVKVFQGAASAIASLRGLGYKVVVVTNQGGVARGKYSEEDVEKVHQRVAEIVRNTSGATIDRFYFCPYHPQGVVEQYTREHPWRKPQPGMLLEAAKDLDLDLMQSWMIGDQMRDIEAGAAAGCRTILLTADAPELAPLRADQHPAHAWNLEGAENPEQVGPTYRARNVVEAVRIIAQQRRPDIMEAELRRSRWDPVARRDRGQDAAEGEASVNQRQRIEVQPTKREPRPTRPFRPWAAAPDDHQGPPAPAGMKPPAVAPAGSPPSPTPGPPASGKPGRQPAPAPAQPPQPAPAKPVPSATTAPPAQKPTPPAPAPETPAAPAQASPAPKTSADQPARRPPPAAAPADEDPPAAPASPRPTRAAPAPPPPARPQTPAPASDVASPTDHDPPFPATASPPAAPGKVHGDGTDEQVLRQILQELRNQRVVADDFSYLKMFATVLQMVAGVCLVGAVVLGGEEADTFLRWASAAIFFQLTVVAALLFPR